MWVYHRQRICTRRTNVALDLTNDQRDLGTIMWDEQSLYIWNHRFVQTHVILEEDLVPFSQIFGVESTGRGSLIGTEQGLQHIQPNNASPGSPKSPQRVPHVPIPCLHFWQVTSFDLQWHIKFLATLAKESTAHFWNNDSGPNQVISVSGSRHVHVICETGPTEPRQHCCHLCPFPTFHVKFQLKFWKRCL